MPIITRFIILLLAAASGSVLAQTQSYPSRPVRIIVGFAAGGPSDIVARIVAQQLTDRLGRSVVVEKLRGIAVTGAKRSTIAPEFPTIAESGLKGYEVVTWFGILTTAGTPGEIVTRLNNEIVQMLAVPAVREHITKLGLEIVGNSPEQYAAFLKEENVKWGNMVKALNLRAE